MKRSRPRSQLFFFLFFFFLVSKLAAESPGLLLGQVKDEEGKPLENVVVVVKSPRSLFSASTSSDRDGFFQVAGIPPAEVSLTLEHDRFRAQLENRVVFEPSQILLLRIALRKGEGPTGQRLSTDVVDLSDSSCRTVIDSRQTEILPSAGNLWSVIENQDLSATTNRIDVGGMWADIPALFSSRGGVSWTQTTYLLNGMDVTDPYWRGTSLFHPNIFSLRFAQHSNGRHPVSLLSPGGYLDLMPKQGSSEFHGGLSAFWSAPWMSSSNISPRLEKEGLFENHRLNSFQQLNGQVSGPLVRDRLFLYAALSDLNLSRDIADFDVDDKASLSSALLDLTYRLSRGSVELFWTGQVVRQPTRGASRDVPLASTLDQKQFANVLQLVWKSMLKPNHYFQLGATCSQNRTDASFQETATSPHGLEVFTKIPSGAAPAAGRDRRASFVLLGKGEALWGSLARVHHRLEYGLSFQHVSSSSEEDILGNIHLHYFNGRPLEIARFKSPVNHSEKASQLDLFAQDTLTFPSLFSFSYGLHLVATRGWTPSSGDGTVADESQDLKNQGGRINWLNLSPRLCLSLPFSKNKSLMMRVSAARYYFHLPLYYLTYGNPGAAAIVVYAWDDANANGRFEEGEEGRLIRKEGPFYARIDPHLERPFSDEYSMTITKVFKKNMALSLGGFYRETRRLAETVNIGVPLSAYDPFQIFDPGDDTIAGTHDDLRLTVYNQKKETLGQDFFLLTNQGEAKRVSRYRGLDLTLVKKSSRGSVFFFTATATEAIGTTSPGNTEWENDDGVIGSLYDHPNASIFSRGRLRFDRAYTARVGFSVPVAAGFTFAVLAKYYDGQPFARKIIIEGSNQGPFIVQAFYRGQARYEFNMTVDMRLEKAFTLGKARGRIILDCYNIFNLAQATEENEWTGPDFPLRYATEVQSPRLFRLGLSYEF
ncbi:MAG: carboxypeptidase-like regulatory domain-containing protein [Clostridiales bacterium]|nr:carboxypeptidase-like regulatory domain-containing protein [Clostridiales bacterium]